MEALVWYWSNFVVNCWSHRRKYSACSVCPQISVSLICTMVLTNKIQSIWVIMGKVLNPSLIDVEQLEGCSCVCGNNWDVVDCMIFTSCSLILDLQLVSSYWFCYICTWKWMFFYWWSVGDSWYEPLGVDSWFFSICLCFLHCSLIL